MKNSRLLKTSRAVLIAVITFQMAFLTQLVRGQEQLKGETKIEDKQEMAENVLLGNISAGRGADRVAEDVRRFNPFIKSIVLYTREQAEALAGYEKTFSQIQELRNSYTALHTRQINSTKNFGNRIKLNVCRQNGTESDDGVQPNFALKSNSLITPVTEVIAAADKLLSYFRTDVVLRPEVFVPDDKVLVAQVFRGLRARYGNGIELYNQNAIPPEFSKSPQIDCDFSYNQRLVC